MMLVIKTITKKLTLLSLSFALVAGSNVGRADDIEIYFNSADATNNTEIIRSNVLFILDTSGSMNSITSSGQTRMDDLKDAMEVVLNSMRDVNVGLMRFNRGQTSNREGGPVIFPIKNIDGNINDVVGDSGQNTVTEIVNTAFLRNDLDDGEEVKTTHNVTLTDAQLDAFDFGGTQSVVGGSVTFPIIAASDDGSEETFPGECSSFPFMFSRNTHFLHRCRFIGLRFAGVTIAQGTPIGSAFIDLRAAFSDSGGASNTIVGQAVDDAAPLTGFNGFSNDISSRVPTTAFKNWSIPNFTNGNTFSTPDIKNIVQEIVDRPGWASGQAMFFRFQNGAGSALNNNRRGASPGAFREFRARESGTNAAKLRVTIPSSGTEVQGDDQLIALRFTDLNIPQGAVLTEAKLTVTPSSAPVSGVDSTWKVSAEQVDDSAPLTDSHANISNRVGGTTVNWVVDSTEMLVVDEPVASVDIKNVLQSVVDRSGWCGGNALTLILDTTTASANQTRFLHSRDSDSTKAPKLTYKFGVGATGCVKATATSQTAISSDDAEQFGTTVDTIDNDLDIGFDTEQSSNQTIGLRFQNLNVPQGAVILSAEMIFTSRGVSTDTVAFNIKGISEDNVTQFSNTANDITDRTTTTASVPWDAEPWNTGATAFTTSDITPIIQEIVNRSGWTGGNTMGFIIEPGSSTGNRIAETADGDSSKGPRLRVEYQTILETPFKTNRQRLIELVNELPADGFTPITSTMLEAANYWRGDKVDFGLSRGNRRESRVSHPATYCSAANSCNGATINSTTNAFGVKKNGSASSCNITVNPNSNSCKFRFIKGNPNYISPFNVAVECATNHQVLLTDGAAFRGNSGSVKNKIKNKISESSCFSNNNTFKRASDLSHSYSGHEQCAVDLVKFMHEEDQSSAISNAQIVKTHTIGFALSDVNATQFITDMANVGGGDVYAADNAGDLVDVFENILTQVKNDPTSFVAPALATNAFNRLLSRDEVYFGLFTPNLAKAWEGNVKKYRICVASGSCTLGTILDANNTEAIDSSDDKFKDTAQSIWSAAPGTAVIDGKATTQGGAGHEIVDFTSQTFYTDQSNTALASSGQPLDGIGFELNSGNWFSSDLGSMRSAICPTPSTSPGSECEKRMLFLLGKKSNTNPDTDINADQRWSVNDVLHSSPVVLTYNGSDTDNDNVIETFLDKVIYGTNDGTLHMVNGDTGVEEWRFMPSDFWGQQQGIFANGEGNHLYGLDVTPTVQIIDNNSDGIIKPSDSDKVRAFVSSRRGNSNIYALDLSGDSPLNVTTDTIVPKFMWRIEGGVGDFTRLGQTWSQPIITTIAINTGTTIENREVLIFGGGYDTALDNPATYSPSDNGGNDFMGNAIYIVDPEDGSLILSISGTGSGADIQVPDMHYSIPSAVRSLDSDGDGVYDRLYVGDTGGQVWRVDLAPLEINSGYSAAGTSVVGKLAEISVDSVPVKHRRFFEAPSVIQVRDTEFSDEANYDYVLIGTGYRPHPLNREVHDRFYAFRDFQTGANEMRDDSTVNNVSDNEGYPQTSGNAFTDADLVNVTTTVLDGNDASHRAAAGWFYDFTQAGTVAEKVLSSAVTTGGVVTFTTFAPEATASTDPCGASLGLGTAYNFDILSAGAALDFDGDGTITPNDRTFELTSGIPSGVVPVFTTEGVIGIVGVEGGSKQLGKLADLPSERGYWFEESGF